MSAEIPITLSQFFGVEPGVIVKRWFICPDELFPVNGGMEKREQTVATNPIIDFLRTMQEIQSIQAVAFVVVGNRFSIPITLSIDVCAPLIPSDGEAVNAIRLAAKAKAELAGKTIGLLSSNMSIRNTDRANLDLIEEKIRQECREDSSREFLAMYVFQR